MDYKYWDVKVRVEMERIVTNNGKLISSLNSIKTARGKSPSAENYVDEVDGYAVVIKSGSNISKQGMVLLDNADWVEKSVYDAFLEHSNPRNIINKFDILLSSTGDGTLGKCAVFDLEVKAIADGHITLIRVDPKIIDPYYLCDFLRCGFGAEQINRLYTGSTGMIELTPEQVDSIIVDMRSGLAEQKLLSSQVRALETKYIDALKEAESINEQALTILN